MVLNLVRKIPFLNPLSKKFEPKNETEVTLDQLAKRTYEITNQMYNELSYRLEEYVVSLDITDFVQMLPQPI
ncbi:MULTISPECIES: hypothetical protein [Paraburkholderia]|uniref:Uncharacterized protein n=1 Tax=Paraburkholderia podalyriae TaxID=1938811 RepID=A0ABR7Q0G5_9BURK|nr:hypothetical protein [Paraburkholderia podalyriae]MBC8751909.1 hypothetical protein [Paraburkholderia podalyriae]